MEGFQDIEVAHITALEAPKFGQPCKMRAKASNQDLQRRIWRKNVTVFGRALALINTTSENWKYKKSPTNRPWFTETVNYKSALNIFSRNQFQMTKILPLMKNKALTEFSHNHIKKTTTFHQMNRKALAELSHMISQMARTFRPMNKKAVNNFHHISSPL